MAKLDQVGTYRGEVVDSVFKLSAKGFPMLVVTLAAHERYIESTTDLEYYVEQGTIEEATPQWIDWSSFDETVINNMPLFTADISKGEECKTKERYGDEANELSYCERLVTVFGWGYTFSELSDGSYNGKQCLFRVKQNSNPKYDNLDVAWIGGYDDDPTRSLVGLDKSEAAKYDHLISGGGSTKKKASRPKTTTKTTGKRTRAKKGTDVKKTTAPPKAAPAPPPPAPAPVEEEETLPTEDVTPPAGPDFDSGGTPQEAAWAYVCDKASGEDDDTIIDAWTTASEEVAEDTNVAASEFKKAQWKKVATITLKDLAII